VHIPGYGFNKSHSTAYALIAYMTAYLKAHYSVEFMAALLSGDIAARNFKRKDPLVEHLEDCRRMNIEVVPPDVNRSDADFSVHESRIDFGLSAIRGCGGAASAAVARERRENGPFRDIFDFCERVDPSTVNRAAIESLIKAGAFDPCGGNRAACTAVLDRALQSGAAALADRRRGQKGLFDDTDEPAAAGGAAANRLPDVEAWSEKEKLAKEKEVLGFYLSSHPLLEHQQTLSTYCTHTSVEAAALPNRHEAMLGGMIASIKFSHTKNPRPGSTATKYAMWDLEDSEGIMRCILWPEDFARFGHLVEADRILAVRGAIDKRPGSEEANFIVNELIPLEDLSQRFTRGIVIRVDGQRHREKGLEALYEILRGYPGKCELQLVLCLEDQSRVVCQCDNLRIDLNPELRRRVDELLGPGHVRCIAAPVVSSNSNGNGRGANGYGRYPSRN